jgi:uncharacterized protein
MVQIITSGQINIPALTTDDAYISVVAPPNFITGVPTDVIGCVGTASWGPKNTPVHMGSGLDATQQFGQMSAASLGDVHDLATDLYAAFGQSTSQATLEGYAVRVSDGTDTAALGTISVASAATPETATVSGSLTVGDVLKLTATSSAISGSPVTVSYIARAADTTTTMAAGLAAAVNANTALAAVGVYATSSSAVATLYWPAALSPTITWSQSVTGTATETITLASGSGGTGGVTVTALYTGVLGNLCTAIVTAGTQSNTWNVTLVPPVGLSEVYTNLPSAGFSQALVSAINNGQSAARGPSNSFSAAWVAPGVGAPSAGTTTFSGGTDGRTGVTTAILLGSGTTTPATGLYALGDLNPAVGIVWICGLTDTAAVATQLAFNQSYGCSSITSFASGQTVTSAITLANNTGVADPSVLFTKDWVYFYDTINAIQRLIPASPFIGGTWATLGPAQSPGNKPVNLVIGTERNNPQTGNQQYSVSEIGQLESAGITLVTNPIPRGRVFGIRHGQTSSLVAATKPAEYWRMTMYLARSAGDFIGSYVDELQSQSSSDPLRAGFNLQSNQFLNSLVGANQIDNFLVTCKFSSSPSAQPGLGMNTPGSVAQHYLFALWQVTYLSSVRFFVLSLQGGTTVVEVSGSLTQQQATLQPN